MAGEVQRPRVAVTFSVIALSVMAFALLQSLVVPVLHTFQVDLHTSQSSVTWVLTVYLLSASIFTPIMGRIGDAVGKKKMFVASLAAVAAGCLLAALATNLAVMIIGRAIQGVGGGVVPLAFGIIRDEFPRERVSAAIGVIAAITAVGGGAGIVLAGPIVDALNYHWLFWVPMIMAILSAVAALLFIPESPRVPGRISWLPAVLLSAWLIALLVPLSEASEWGWASGRTIGLLVAAVVLAGAWAASEQRAATPLIDLTMMRRRGVWTANLTALLLGVGLYAVFGFVPQFVQTPSSAGYGFGLDITQSGLVLLPMTVGSFLMGAFAAPLADRFSGRIVLFAGSVLGLGGVAMLAWAHDEQWELYVATGLFGLGLGLAYSTMSSLVVHSVPAAQTGVASGMNANIRTIGGSVGSAVMASIVTAKLQPSGLPREVGYTVGFAVLTGAMLVAALVALLVPPGEADETEVVLRHPELGLVAAGTLVGDESE
jgi:EmrB/QacA subfamily drug resistance transporter